MASPLGTVTEALRHVFADHYASPAVRPVADHRQRWTYTSLARRVARVAQWLRSGEAGLSVQSGSFIPFCFDTVPDRVAFQLAVLFTGSCFVPIDPRFPDSRVKTMLEEACSGLAVAGSEEHAFLLRRCAPPGTTVVVLPDVTLMAGVEPLSEIPDRSWFPSDEECGLTGDSPAYVMFTSGSTGRPKGVVVPHRGITRLCIDTNFLHIDPRRDVMMHSSNPAFDYSTLEVFGPLLNGAAMQLVDMDTLLDTARLRSHISKLGITIGCFTTSVFNAHARADISVFSDLRVAFTSGEVADAGLIRRMIVDDGGVHAPRVVCNALGHTEATTFSTFHIAWDADSGTVDLGNDPNNLPVGKAIARSSIRVVADDGSDVTTVAGGVGELWCGGRGVALGYLNRPEATAKAFVSDVSGERWYRTGDVVRVDDASSGSLVFVGRVDNQVKLRGNRIELDEIERALLSHPSVGSAVVLAHGDDPAMELAEHPASAAPVGRAPQRVTKLAAYIEFEAGVYSSLAAADMPSAMAGLRACIEATKPPFMVPALFAHVETMPFGSTGKIDRLSLRGAAATALVLLKQQQPSSAPSDGLAVALRFIREMPPTRSKLAEGTVTAAFLATAAQFSANIAVDDGDTKLTYAQLADRAVGFANWLHAEGVQAGDSLPFCLPPVADRIVLQLATLFCGAAFVPIDKFAPGPRIAAMLSSTGATVAIVLADDDEAASVLVNAIPASPLRVLALPSAPSGGDAVKSDSALGITPDSPAYVMYTSGSTGAPKGVIVPHRGITRLCIDSGPLELLPSDVMLHAANPAFDASTLEVFAPLLCGGTVALAPTCTMIDAPALSQMLRDRCVTAAFFTTSVFNAHALSEYCSSTLGSLRAVYFGGEVASPVAVRRLCEISPPEILVNGYGPTEATTFSAIHVVWNGTLHLGSDPGNIPIGVAVSRSFTRVIAEDGSDLSAVRGAVGELWCGGRGVALGYLGRPEATAKAFVRDSTGGRWYRTGDLVRVEDPVTGRLAFVGRLDHQVKLRGNRIELDEIERLLFSHPSVTSAVVLPHGDDANVACPPARVTRIGAYVLLKEQARISPGPALRELREYLCERVVNAAVPALFASVKSIGHTSTGKLDRNAVKAAAVVALARRDRGEGDCGGQAALQSIVFLSALSRDGAPGEGETLESPEVAQLMAEVTKHWCEVLRIPASSLGTHSDWFELGGDSLQAATAARLIGCGCRGGDVLQARTPLCLSRRLVSRNHDDVDRAPLQLPVIPAGTRVPLTYAQWGLIAHEEAVRAASGQLPALIYHEHLSQEMPEHVDVPTLLKALRLLAGRHDILRLRIDLKSGEQWATPAESMADTDLLAEVHDLRSLTAATADQRMARLCASMGIRELRLHEASAFRTAVFLLPQTSDGRCRTRLHWLCHHLIVDGVGTFNILFPDLEAVYTSLERGVDIPLPLSDATYVGWATVEQSPSFRESRSAEWQEQLAFWRSALRDSRPHTKLERLCGDRLPLPLPFPANVAAGKRLNFELPAPLADRLRTTAQAHGISLFSLLAWATSTLLSRWTHERSVTLLSIVAQRQDPATADLAGDLLNTIALPFVHDVEPLIDAVRRFSGVCSSALRHSDVPFSMVAADAAPPGFASELNVVIVLEPGQPTDDSENRRGWTWSQREVFSGAAKFDLTLEFDDRGNGQDTLCRAEYRTSTLTPEAASRFVQGLCTFLENVSATEAGSCVTSIFATEASCEELASSGAYSALSPLALPRPTSVDETDVVGLWCSADCPLPVRADAIVAAVSSGASLLIVDPSETLVAAKSLVDGCGLLVTDKLYLPAAELIAPSGSKAMLMDAIEWSTETTAITSVRLNSDSDIEDGTARAERISWLAHEVLGRNSKDSFALIVGAERDSLLETELILAVAASGRRPLTELPADNVEAGATFSIVGPIAAVENTAVTLSQLGRRASSLVAINQSENEPIAPSRLRALHRFVQRGDRVVLATVIDFKGGQLLAANDACHTCATSHAPAGTVVGEPHQPVALCDAVGAPVAPGTVGCLHITGVDSGILAAFTAAGDLVLIHPDMPVTQALPLAPVTSAVSQSIPVVTQQNIGGNTATVLQSLMAAALGTDSFGLDDDFYALGGDSMSAIQLVSAAAQQGIALRVSMIARLRSPKAIAGALGGNVGTPVAATTTTAMAVVTASAPPATQSTSAVLCALMAEALGTATFGADDDFYALGGDSMSAIQLVSAASAKGLALRVSMIARLRTPAAIAAALGDTTSPTSSVQMAPTAVQVMPTIGVAAEVESGEYPASAIHRWLDGLQLANPGHNDQSFVLAFAGDQRLPALSRTWLQRALEVLVAHHDGLRMRMSPSTLDSAPLLRIAEVGSPDTLPLVFDAAEVDDARLLLHRALDPVRGPTVAAAVTDGGGAAWLAVHHIAVDIFSWNILTADLGRAYEAVAERGGLVWDSRVHPAEVASAVLPPRTAGPGAWAEAQHGYANSALSVSHAREWETALAGAEQPTLPAGVVTARNDEVQRAEGRIPAAELAELQTFVVQRSAGTVSLQAVALAALAAALGNTEESVVVWLEGHGRDGEAFLGNQAPDVSRTVGWFTAMYPFALAPASGGAAAQQRQITAVLHGGTSFNVIRQLSPIDSVRKSLVSAAGGPPAVLFNFAGMGLAGGKGGRVKERLSLSTAYAGPFGGPENSSLAPIVVNCIANADQELVTTFDYGVGPGGDAEALRTRLARMAGAFVRSLRRQIVQAMGTTLLPPQRLPHRAASQPLALGREPASTQRLGHRRVASLPPPQEVAPLSPAPSAELLIQLHAPQGIAATRPALFLIHPAGGQAAAYTVLVDAMASCYADGRGPLPVPVFGIEMTPFREGLETLESVAAQYVGVIRAQQPTGPWLVGGWSLGGLLAHEVARQIECTGGRVLLVMHLDSHHPALDHRFRDFCVGLVKSDVALLALLWRHVELVADQRASRVGDGVITAHVPLTYDEVKLWPQAERRARFVARVVEGGLLPIAAAQAFVPRFLQTFYDAVGLILACAEEDVEALRSRKIAAPAVFVRATEVTSAPFEGFTVIEEDLEVSRAKGDLTYGWQQLYVREMKVELVAGSHETFAFDPYAKKVAEALVGHIHDAIRGE